MSVFNKEDLELRAAALKAGIRTAEQTFSAGLGVGTGGGIIVGAVTTVSGNAFKLDYVTLLGALLFLVLSSFFAGLKAFLSISSNGLPSQYTAAAGSSSAVNGAVTALTAAGITPASIPTVTVPTYPPTPEQAIVREDSGQPPLSYPLSGTATSV